MAREAEDRFASMGELNQALEDYLRRGGGKRSETAPPSRDSVAPRSQSPPPHIPPEIRVPSRAATAPQRIAVSPMEITSPRTGMVLLRIEAGEFMMGSPDSDKDAEDDEKPRTGCGSRDRFTWGIRGDAGGIRGGDGTES